MVVKLPDLEFVVDELLLESRGGSSVRARQLADALLHHAQRGSSLDAYAKRLAVGLAKLDDKLCRDRVARSLAYHAAATGDDKLLAKAEQVVPTVRKMLQRSGAQTKRKELSGLCQKLERACGDRKPIQVRDIRELVSRLGEKPVGRGLARIDPAWQASYTLMRVLAHPGAAAAARRALEHRLSEGGAAGHDARRTLIGAAAYAERWADVDALTATKGPALLATANGFSMAVGRRLFDTPPRRAERAAALASFKAEIEPRLQKLAKKTAAAKVCRAALDRLARGR
jgi:hypothetical protein